MGICLHPLAAGTAEGGGVHVEPAGEIFDGDGVDEFGPLGEDQVVTLDWGLLADELAVAVDVDQVFFQAITGDVAKVVVMPLQVVVVGFGNVKDFRVAHRFDDAVTGELEVKAGDGDDGVGFKEEPVTDLQAVVIVITL